MSKARKKICVITCYKYPEYVRGEALRSAVGLNPDYQLISVKNRHKSFLRYLEVAIRLAHARVIKRPDVYILTFRGYEMLPFVRLVTIGKRLLFDEFINLVEWAVYEHKKIKTGGLGEKLLSGAYKFWLRRAGMILTDTGSHAAYSSQLTNISRDNYAVLPVGADERLFKPGNTGGRKKHRFEVLYYGNMLPLHGAGYVIEAAVKLAKKGEDIRFTLIGGDKRLQDDVENANKQGANIRYIKKVPLKRLPEYVQKSDICLGGPFGGTLQGDMVITGKTFQFLAMGKPALIGKNKESGLFNDKENCLVVDQKDAAGLARAISWSAKNPKKLQEIGKNGNRLYKEKFSNRIISQRLADLIDRTWS